MTSSSTAVELKLPGRAIGLAYCKETRSLLLCTHDTVEYYHLSSFGISLQPQRTFNWVEKSRSRKSPASMRIASKTGAIFIGSWENEGIYVFDGKSHQLIKQFAQNMGRDFQDIVVDETEDPQCCTVYTCSTDESLLTKLDYNSGSKLSELFVRAPYKMILKDDKLFLLCWGFDDCILVIDKHSLKIQRKMRLSNWSDLGGLCLDESGNVCVTALDKSKHRFIYSFDDGGNLVREVLLADFHEHKVPLDMVVVDNELIMLSGELDVSHMCLNKVKLN